MERNGREALTICMARTAIGFRCGRNYSSLTQKHVYKFMGLSTKKKKKKVHGPKFSRNLVSFIAFGLNKLKQFCTHKKKVSLFIIDALYKHVYGPIFRASPKGPQI